MKADEFREILSDLTIGLPAKVIVVDKSEYFHFLPNKIITYNDNISVFKSVDLRLSKKPFGIASDDLLSILDNLSDKDIGLELVKNKLVLSSGKTRVKFTIATEVDEFINYVDKLDFNQVSKKLKLAPRDFMTGLESCCESAVAKYDQEIVLTGLLIDNDKVVGSDRFRISEYKLSKSLGTTFILPRNTVINLLKFKDSEKISFYDDQKSGWVYFGINDTLIACRKIAGEYLPYSNFFELANYKILHLPERLLKLISVAEVMSDGESDSDKLVELSFDKNNRVTIKSSKKSGEVIGTLTMRSKKNFSFKINPIFLNKISQKVKTIKVGDDKVLFERNNFRHVISLR